ncbi:unnamed protein product [Periconia digitata]|uniref:Uncharacterized protein n=1 Tax=Periconia digitata TaxID=1303443 RepID=A0A9W4UDF3_9PLEO|nr:unnamed protein product [Periconia digitata]
MGRLGFTRGKKASFSKSSMTARPSRPARAVRPTRWMYCSVFMGRPSCTTSETLGKSMPRPTTSEATRIPLVAALKSSVVWVRALCDMRLWSSKTRNEGRATFNMSYRRPTPFAVVPKTIILEESGLAECSLSIRARRAAKVCLTFGTVMAN